MERKDMTTAAAENSYFRGLFGVLGGLLMILSALGNAGWGLFEHDMAFFAGLAALALSAVGLNQYYNDKYGRSRPTMSHHRRMAVAMFVGAPVVFFGSLLLSSRASWSLNLPLNTIAISMALITLMVIAATVGLRAHHVVIFGVLLAAGLLPVWEREGMSGNTGLWMAGVAFIINGLLDHRLLVRRFGSAREEDHAGA
ncbi:MAG: hypothetical protein QOH68_3099 [Nocardioidaceae bacterium]|nr:hypothetical protein [Nocardioidaceae bacterium]